MRARLTVQVSAPPNASLNVRVLDSAGQEAGKGSGSVGPAGGVIDLPLDIDVLPDDAPKPLKIDDDNSWLSRTVALLEGFAIEHDFSEQVLIAECMKLVLDLRNLGEDALLTGSRVKDVRDAIARRLARIAHLEARDAERAAGVPAGPRATG